MNGRTGFTWFKARNPYSKKVVSVGLSSAIVEYMRWVLEAGGLFSGGGETDVRVEKADEITRANGWRKFGCVGGELPLAENGRDYILCQCTKSRWIIACSLYCSSEGCKFPTPRNSFSGIQAMESRAKYKVTIFSKPQIEFVIHSITTTHYTGT
ncbi:hypothetical protein ACFX2A_024347 [Malus domestica]